MGPQAVFVAWIVALLAALPAASAEKVVLRVPGGRLLEPAENGTLRAGPFVPAAKQTFDLVCLAGQQVAVKGPGGSWLVADARDGSTPRLAAGAAEPGERETFELVRVAAGRTALRSRRSGALLVFGPAAGPRPPQAPAPAGAVPPGTVEICKIRELSAMLQINLRALIGGLAVAELVGKQYDQTQTRKVEKYIRLPDPTLKEPGRMKRHQVLGLSEESRVQAKLEGSPDIQIPAMPLLASCAEGRSGRMLVAVEAALPIQGRVQYRVPNAVSVATSYHTTVRLSAVVEVTLRRSGKDLAVGPPTVLDLSVSLSHLKLSNDLLDAARRQIERFVNRELRQNEGRIREQANRAIEKAVSSHEVQIPLLGWVGW